MSTIEVGFIGLGNMGMPMAKSLVKNGFPLTVFDLRKEAIVEMESLGAKAAGSCQEVATVSDVIISMVRDVPETNEVIFGKDGLWEGIEEGKTIIISSSVGPEYCQKLYSRAKDKGVRVIDCAVSDPSGRSHQLGELTLMIGGDEDAVKKCWHIFEALGKNIFYLGGIGKGQVYKLVNNMAARHIGTVSRVCLIECLNLGLKAGLDLQKMIDVMSVSAGARNFQNMGLSTGLDLKKIIELMRVPVPRTPGTKAHQVDELDYAMEMAEALGVKMPVCRFIDELDMASVYDMYSALVKKYTS